MSTLAYPFTLLSDGGVKSLEQYTDAHKAQEIAAFMKTHQGERTLFPTFGVTDPTFADLSSDNLATDFAGLYEETITLTTLDIIKSEGAIASVRIGFE